MDRYPYDWPEAVDTTWVFAFRYYGFNATGGQAEIAIWDASDNLVAWAATSGRTAPPAGPAVGTMAIAYVADPEASTFTAQFEDAQNSGLSGPYKYQFDWWDAAGKHWPGFAGNILANGVPMP